MQRRRANRYPRTWTARSRSKGSDSMASKSNRVRPNQIGRFWVLGARGGGGTRRRSTAQRASGLEAKQSRCDVRGRRKGKHPTGGSRLQRGGALCGREASGRGRPRHGPSAGSESGCCGPSRPKRSAALGRAGWAEGRGPLRAGPEREVGRGGEGKPADRALGLVCWAAWWVWAGF